MEQRLREFYASWAASYDQSIESKAWHIFDINFLEQLSIPIHSEIVDVGGGTGRMHRSLLRHSPSKIAVIEPSVEMRNEYYNKLASDDPTNFYNSWQEYFSTTSVGIVSLVFAYSINHFSSLEHIRPLINKADNCIILMRNPDINLIRGGMHGVHTVHAGGDSRVADFRHGLEAIFAMCLGSGLQLRVFREHISYIHLNHQILRMATNLGLHFCR